MFFTAEPEAAMELKQLGSIESRNGSLSVLVKPSPPPRGKDGRNSEARPTFIRGGYTNTVGRDSDVSMNEDSSEIIQVWLLLLVHLIVL